MFLKTAAVQVGRENKNPFADLLDRLRNFIKRGGQRLDVFALERRDESLAELLGQLLRDPFVFAPAIDEFVKALRRIVMLELPKQRDEMMDAAVRLLGAGLEQVIELFVVT